MKSKLLLLSILFALNFFNYSQTYPPTCVITQPYTNAYFKAGTDIDFHVYSSDIGKTTNNGTVTKVEFFNGTTKLGEATTHSNFTYKFKWTCVPAGTYTLKAKSTNSNGVTFTSVGTIITVGTNNVARVDTAKKMLLEAHMKANDNNINTRPIYGFGVDEKAAVIYEGGKLSIWSAGRRATGVGEATCHILFVNNLNEVMCIPMTPTTGEVMTLDEMIERAKRSVMALQSPLDLIVSESVSQACHRRGYSGAIDMITLVDDPTVFEQALRDELPVVSGDQDPLHVPPIQESSLRNGKVAALSPSPSSCSELFAKQ